MKNLKLIAIFTLMAALCFGQTAMTTTTTAAAITSKTASTVVLTSATNVSANGYLYVDGEVMRVNTSYTSGTTIPVMRGQSGTNASTHATLSPVWIVAPGTQSAAGFLIGPAPGANPSGSCTATSLPILPVINVTTQNRYDCLGSKWVRTGIGGAVVFCGATSGTTTCAPATGITSRAIGGIATLSSNAAVISGISPAFTSTSTFSCVGNDITTRANPVQVVQTSSSSITITNTTGASDVVNWLCVGY